MWNDKRNSNTNMRNNFGAHLVRKKKGKKKTRRHAEMIHELSRRRTIRKIHDCISALAKVTRFQGQNDNTSRTKFKLEGRPLKIQFYKLESLAPLSRWKTANRVRARAVEDEASFGKEEQRELSKTRLTRA